jgi:hypothetical protein|tara:strand:- start:216 stop:443 length:228 start_codon:yes stop_codon:yes gene_type:complete
MEKLDRKLEKLKIDINGYHDIVSDLRGVWADLKGILDYGDEREKDILDGVLGIVDEFEEYIFESMNKIEKLKENK